MDMLMRPYAVPGAPGVITLTHGSGCVVVDDTGREYLDAVSGLWNVTLGLGHEEIIERMTRQLRSMAYGGLFDSGHTQASALAQRLIAACGQDMAHVYLSTTGTSAVEVALHVARLHFVAREQPHKRNVLSFDCGYHGCSLVNLSASRIVHHELSDRSVLSPHFESIPAPSDEAKSLQVLETKLVERGHEFSSLLVEPVPASGGVIVASRAYWAQVNELCRRHDVLVVADEVATGGGRCGAFLASPLVGLQPAIIALSKAVNSGYYPTGATLFTREVVAPIQRAKLPLDFGSTQDGNPVGCAAALAVLDIIEREGLCQRAVQLGGRIVEQLSALEAPVVRAVRGLGLMIAIDLQHRDLSRFSVNEAAEVRAACREEGLLVYHYEGGLNLFPALTMSDEQAELAVAILGDVLATLD